MLNKLDKIIKILNEINERLIKLENKDKKINIVQGSRVNRVVGLKTNPSRIFGGR